MAKARTKELWMSVRADEVSPGVWEWTYEGRKWRYDSCSPGLNLAWPVETGWRAYMHLPTIREAVAFTVGYDLGYRNGFAGEAGN